MIGKNNKLQKTRAGKIYKWVPLKTNYIYLLPFLGVKFEHMVLIAQQWKWENIWSSIINCLFLCIMDYSIKFVIMAITLFIQKKILKNLIL